MDTTIDTMAMDAGMAFLKGLIQAGAASRTVCDEATLQQTPFRYGSPQINAQGGPGRAMASILRSLRSSDPMLFDAIQAHTAELQRTGRKINFLRTDNWMRLPAEDEEEQAHQTELQSRITIIQ